MTLPHHQGYARRQFLRTAGGVLVGWSTVGLKGAEPATAPSGVRAISGDSVEPNWQERVKVTVGPTKADLVGTSDKVIQAAVDYVARMGGGTVQVLPGTYTLRNAIWMRSNIRLLGSGLESVLTKVPMEKTNLSANADWYDQEITLADAKGFQVGDGVLLHGQKAYPLDFVRRTLIARSGNTFKLNEAVRPGDYFVKEGATVANLFSLVEVQGISDVMIENLALDGDKANNEYLDDNYGGALNIQDSNRVTVRRVAVKNFNGDGIIWQMAHDIVVQDCHSHDNAGLGLHPGSGSQRPNIARNRLERNTIGLFFCWGVRFGVAEKNVALENRECGISIGYRDNDNIVRDNEIRNSGQVGILLRKERESDQAPRRIRVERNRIFDSGPENGVGIDVQGWAEEISIAQNEIHETRSPMKRVGIRLASDTQTITLADNKIDGFSQPILNLGARG